MNETMGSSEDNTQSFVLRIWEEEPGQRRGTIRHVQSQAHRGFTKLGQAVEFVERYLGSLSTAPATERQPFTFGSLFYRGLLPRARYQLAAVAAGVMALLAVSYLVLSPRENITLAGTAAGVGDLTDWMIFLGGFLLGILVACLWLRSNK